VPQVIGTARTDAAMVRRKEQRLLRLRRPNDLRHARIEQLLKLFVFKKNGPQCEAHVSIS
jgi:hypothetical protein